MNPSSDASPPFGRAGARLGRAGLLLTLILASMGIWLIADAACSARGSGRHRLAGYLAGAGLVVPFALALVRPLRPLLARIALSFGVGFVLLAVVELGVRVFDIQAVRAPVVADDPVLGLRFVGGTGRIDELGFRNAEVPDRADVVCVGDSQTYGHGVARHEAYPAQLATLLGDDAVVYSMALGSYGPVQYLELVRRAERFLPAHIVCGLYLGNDLLNSHQAACLEAWRELRDPAIEYPVFENPVVVPPPAPNLTMALVDAAVDRSYVVGWVVHVLRMQARQSAMLADTYRAEPGAPAWRRGAIETLLTPMRRLPALDPTRLPVIDGVRITRACLRRAAARARGFGSEFTVLLLHTKEFHYAGMFAEAGLPVPEAVAAIREHESRWAREIRSWASVDDYAIVDSADSVDAFLRADRPLWPRHADGHYAASGHRVLAELLADILR